MKNWKQMLGLDKAQKKGLKLKAKDKKNHLAAWRLAVSMGVAVSSMLGVQAVAAQENIALDLKRADTGTTITNGNVHDIYAGQVNGSMAINRFDKFDLAQQNIANMHFNKYGTTAEADKLFNFVKDKINIAGTVNAIKANQNGVNSIGGQLYFLSPKGMLVSGSGVINAGALTVMAGGAHPGNDKDALAFANDVESGKYMLEDNVKGDITIEGKINAVNNIVLQSSKQVMVLNGAQLQVAKTIDFGSLVNIDNIQSGLSEANNNLVVARTGNGGNILLRAVAQDKNDSSTIDGWMKTATENTVKAEVKMEEGTSLTADGTVSLGAHATLAPMFGNLATFGNITQTTASVEVNGAITASNIAITADNSNSYELGALEKGAKTLKAFGTDFLQRYFGEDMDSYLDLDIGFIGMKANSQVNIGGKAKLNAYGADSTTAAALNINSTSNVKIFDELGANVSSTEHKKILASGLLYTYVENDANITVKDGAVLNTVAQDSPSPETVPTAAEAGSVSLKSAAKTNIEANSSVGIGNSAMDSGSKAAAAVVFSRGATNAKVDFGNATLTAAKDAVLKANTSASVKSNSLVVIGPSTEGSTAVDYYGVDSDAQVNIKGTVAAEEKVDVAAVNEENIWLKVNNAVNPDGSGSWIGLLANPSYGNWSSLVNTGINYIMKNSEGVRNPGAFTFGAAIGLIDIDNTASVNIANTADIKGKSVDINAKQEYAQLRMTSNASTSKIKKDDGALVNISAAVGVVQTDDSAVVNIEGDSNTSKAKITATQGDLKLTADSEYLWNRLENLESGILSNIKKLSYADLRKAKEEGAQVPEIFETYAADPTDENAQKLYNALKKDPGLMSWVAGTVDNIFNLGKLARSVAAYTNAAQYVNLNVGSSVRPNSQSPKDVAIAGSGLYTSFDRKAEVIVGRGAELTAKKDLALLAKVKQVDANYVGEAQGVMGTFGKDLGVPDKFSQALGKLEIDPKVLPGWSKSEGDVFGGNLGIYNNTLQSGVLVAEGAKLQADNIDLKADTDLQRLLVSLGGGAAGETGITGMFSVHNGITNSVVAVDDEATLTADNKLSSNKGISLGADNDSLIINVEGDLTVGTANAVGASGGYAKNEVNTLAGVKDIDKELLEGSVDKDYYAAINQLLSDEQKAYLGLAATNIKEHSLNGIELKVDATSTPILWNIAAAGAVAKEKSQPPAGDVDGIAGLLDEDALEGLNHLDDDEENNGIIGDINGGEQQLSKAKVIGAGAVDINKLKGLTAAVLENTTVNITGGKRAVALNAYEDGMAVALAGALSLKTSGASSASFEAMLAGTSGVNLVDMDVVSKVKQTAINNALAFSNKAKQAEKIVATAVPVAINAAPGSEQSKGFEAALNASVNDVNNSVLAKLENATVAGQSETNTTRVQNYADDESTQITGGVQVDVAKNTAGVGVNVAWARLNNDVKAQIAGGNYDKVGAMENIAASNLTQINMAIGMGVSTGEQNKITAGALWSNAIIDNDATAAVTADADGKGAVIKAASFTNEALDGTISSETTDDTWTETISKTDLLKSFGVDADGGSIKENIGKEKLVTEVDTEQVEDKVEKAEAYDTDDTLDPAATTTSNYTNSQLTFKDDKKTLVINGGLLIEGSGSTASIGGGGIALVDSLIDNDYKAEISTATITLKDASTAENAALKNIATSEGEIYNVAAGASVTTGDQNYLNLSGSAAAAKLRNDTISIISDSGIETSGLQVEAENDAKMVTVAGAINGGQAKAGVGLAIAVNDLGNTTEAKILGSTISGMDKAATAIKVHADNDANIYAVAAGIGVTPEEAALGGQGNIAVNVGYNNTEAAVARSTKQVKETDAEGKEKTVTVTKNKAVINNAEKLEVLAENTSYQAASAAGLQKTNGKAGVGIGFAVNKISDQTMAARLNYATVTTADNAAINVKTDEAASLTTVGLGLSLAGANNKFAFEGAAAITLAKDKNNIAEIVNTTITKGKTSFTGAEVKVEAKETNTIISNADSLNFSLNQNELLAIGIGAAGVNLDSTTEAKISNSTITAENILVNAEANQTIYDVGVGVGGGTATVNGAASLTFNYLNNDVKAVVEDSTLTANNNIGVLAQGQEELVNFSGGTDITVGGTVGVGLAVAYNDLEGDITATVKDSELKALGKGSADKNNQAHSYTTNDKNEITLNDADKHQGLVIDAYGKHTITDVALTLGVVAGTGQSGVGVGLDGLGSHTIVDGTTGAYLTNSDVNKATSTKGEVVITAFDDVDLHDVDVNLTIAAGKNAGISGGISVAMADLERTIEAQATGKEEGASDKKKRNTVDAKKLQIEAGGTSSTNIVSVGVGVGGSTTAGVAVGALADAITNNKTINASLTNINSKNEGLTVTAANDNFLNYKSVGVLVGGAQDFGGSVGVSVGSMKQTNEVSAKVENTTVTHTTANAEDVVAVTNHSKAVPNLVAVNLAGAEYGALAVGVAVDNYTVSDKLSLDVINSQIGEAEQKAKSAKFEVNNYLDIDRDSVDVTIAAAIGSVAVGVNVQPTTINSSEVMNVTRSSVYADTIELETAEYRKLQIDEISASGGTILGVGVNRSYTTLGGQLMTTYGTQYNGQHDAEYSDNLAETMSQANEAIDQGKEKIKDGVKGVINKLNTAAEEVVKDQEPTSVGEEVKETDHYVTVGEAQQEGLKINSSSSNYEGSNLTINSTVTDDIDVYSGSGSFGIGAVNVNAARVDENLKNTININGGKLKADNISIVGKVTGDAYVHAAIGTVGGIVAEVAYADIYADNNLGDMTGNSITIKNAGLEVGKKLQVEALDSASYRTKVSAGGVKILGGGYIEAESTDKLDSTVKIANATIKSKDANIDIVTNKSSLAKAETIYGGVAGIGGLANSTTAKVEGKSDIVLKNNIITGNVMDLNAMYSAHSLVDMTYGSGELAGGGGVYGHAKALGQATISAEKNIFDLEVLNAESMVRDNHADSEDPFNMAETHTEAINISLGVGVNLNEADATIETIADTSFKNNNFAHNTVSKPVDVIGYEEVDKDGVTTYEPLYRYENILVGKTEVNLKSTTSAEAKADILGVSVGAGIAVGHNSGNITVKESTTAAMDNSGLLMLGTDDVKIYLKKLSIETNGTNVVDNRVDGRGGGIVSVSPKAVSAENNLEISNKAAIKGGYEISNALNVTATQKDNIEIQGSTASGGVLDVAGGDITNNRTFSSEKTKENVNRTVVDIADATIKAGTAHVSAANDMSLNKNREFGMKGGAGGAIQAASPTTFTNNLDEEAKVLLTNASITTDDSIALNASTLNNVFVKSTFSSGGALMGENQAEATNNFNYANNILVDGDSELKTNSSAGDISITSVDDTNLQVGSYADAYGIVAAIALPVTNNTTERTNKIDIAGEIFSSNSLKLYSGQYAKLANAGLNAVIDVQSLGSGVIVPVAKNELHNTIKENNIVNIQKDATTSSVGSTDIYANEGLMSILVNNIKSCGYSSDVSSQEYYNYVTTQKHQGKDALNSNDFVKNNAVTIEGTATAGAVHRVGLTIGNAGEIVILDETDRAAYNASNKDKQAVAKPTITYSENMDQTEGVELSFKNVNISLSLAEAYEEAQNTASQYSNVPTSEAYMVAKAKIAALEEQMIERGMVQLNADGSVFRNVNGNVVPTTTLRTDAVVLPDISVSGGDISINTQDLISSEGTMKAYGYPEVNITNNTNLYMLLGNVSVGENGGNIFYTNSSGTKYSLDNTVAADIQAKNERINQLNATVKDTNFKAIEVESEGTGGNAGQINIKGAYSGPQFLTVNPHDYDPALPDQKYSYKVFSDIELAKGNSLVSSKGSVIVESDNNNLYINGDVIGREVQLSAVNGSLYQNAESSAIDIGGDVIKQYDSIVRDYINPEDPEKPKDAEWKGKDDHYSYDIDSSIRVLNSANGRILGENIYIMAESININGLIQSGFENYTYTVTPEDIATMSELDNQYRHQAYTDDNIIAMGKDSVFCINKGVKLYNITKDYYDYSVPVYYNPTTGRILIPNVESKAGNIYLSGKISSTGDGRIVAMDGTYDINIDTSNSSKDVKLYGLVTTDNQGKISILDTQRHTLSVITRDSYNVTPLTGNWDTPSTANVVVKNYGGYDYQYNPEANQRYSWIMGMDSTNRTFYQRKYEENWWGIRKSKDVTDDIGHATRLDQLSLVNQAKDSTNHIGDLGTTGYDNFHISANKVHTKGETSTPTVTRWETGLWGYRKHELYKWYVDSGDTYQYNISVDASKPVNIKFIGNEQRAAKVNVTTGGSVNLHGDVGNKDYLTTDNVTSKVDIISKAGNISQDKGIIAAGDVYLRAADSITGIDIEAKDKLNLAARSLGLRTIGGTDNSVNNIDINAHVKGENATVALVGVNGNINGNAELADHFSLTTNADIVQELDTNTNVVPVIAAARIDLVSTDGSIGSADKLLLVDTADTPTVADDSMSASLNARGKGSIYLEEKSNDVRVGKISSENGEVVLAGPGSLVDALPYENNQQGLSDEELITRWSSMGLFDDRYYINEEGEAVKAMKWDAKRLLYAIADEKINPTGVATSDKPANIKATDLTLKMGNSAGLNSEKTTEYKISELGTTDSIEDLKALAKADASSVEWNAEQDKVIIREKLPIGVELSGKLNLEANGTAEGQGNAYVEVRKENTTANTNTDLNVEAIRAQDDVLLRNSFGSINSVAPTGTAAIVAHNLDIGAGQSGTDNSFVGTADNYMTIDIDGTLRAVGTGGVYIKQLNQENPLVVANVYSNGNVYLESVKDIISTTEGNTRSYINWGEGSTLNLISTDGSVGTEANAIRILNEQDLAEGETPEAKRKLNITAKNDAYIEGYSLDVSSEEPAPMGTFFVNNINVGNSINIKDNGNIYIVNAEAETINLEAKAAILEAEDAELTVDYLTVQAATGISLTSDNNKLRNIAFYNSKTGDIEIVNGDQATGDTVITQAGTELGLSEQGTIDGEVKLVAKKNALLNKASFKTNGDVFLESQEGSVENLMQVMTTNGDVTVTAGTSVSNAGKVLAYGGDAVISAGTFVENQGNLLASKAAVINAGTDINNSGDLHSGLGTEMAAGGNIDNSGMLMASSGPVTVISTNGNVYNHEDADLVATNGNVIIKSEAKAADSFVKNEGDIITVSGDITIESEHGSVYNYDDFGTFDGDLAYNGVAITTGNIALRAGEGKVYNASDLIAAEDVTIVAKEGLENFSYNIYAGKNITLTATSGNVVNTSVLEAEAGNVKLNSQEGSVFNMSGGDIVATGGNVELVAQGAPEGSTVAIDGKEYKNGSVVNYGDIVASNELAPEAEKATAGGIMLKSEKADVYNYDDFNRIHDGITYNSINVATNNVTLSAANGVLYNSVQDINALGSVTLEAKEGLASVGNNIHAGKDITLIATEGDMVNRAELVSVEGNINLEATQGAVVNMLEGDILAMAGDVTLHAGGAKAEETVYAVNPTGQITKVDGDFGEGIVLVEKYYIAANGEKTLISDKVNVDALSEVEKASITTEILKVNDKGEHVATGVVLTGDQEVFRQGDVVNRGDIVALGSNNEKLGKITLRSENSNVTNYDNFALVNGSAEYTLEGTKHFNENSGLSQDQTYTLGRVDEKGKLVADNDIALAAPNGYFYNNFNIETKGDLELVTKNNIVLGDDVSVIDVAGSLTVESTQGTVTGNGDAINVGKDLTVKGQNGVDLEETITAGGDVTVESGAGDVALSGEITSGGEVKVEAAQDATVSGNVTADENVSVSAGKDVTVTGDVTSGKDTIVTAGNDALLSGDIEAKGDVTVKAENKVESTGDKIESEGAVDISGVNGVTVDNTIKAGNQVTVESEAGSITLNGAVESGAEVEVTAKVDADVNAAVKAEGDVAVKAGNDATVSGEVNSGKDASVEADHNATVSGNVTADENVSVAAGNDATVSGNVIGGKDTTITAGNDALLSGDIEAKGDVTIKAENKVESTGDKIESEGAVDISGNNGVTVDNTIKADDKVAVESDAGSVTLNGAVESGAEVEVTAKGDADVNEALKAEGNVAVKAGNDVTVSGNVTSGKDAIVTAGNDASVSGDVTSAESFLVGAGNDATVSGTVNSGKDASVEADHDVTISGNVTADENVSVGAGDDATVSGNIASGKDTTVTAGNDALLSGDIEAKGDVTVKAENKVESTGDKIEAEGAVDISGVNGVTVDNAIKADDKVAIESSAASVTLNGAVEAGAEVEVTAKVDAEVNAAVKAEGDVAVKAGNDASVSGDIEAKGDVTVKAENEVVSTGDKIEAEGAVDISGTNGVTVDNTIKADDKVAVESDAGSVTLNGAVESGAEVAITAKVDADVNKAVKAEGYVAVKAGNDASVSGDVNSAENFLVTAGNDATVSGEVNSGKDASVEAEHNATVSGNVTADENVSVTAGNDAAVSGDVTSGKDASVEADHNATISGNVTAEENVSVSAGNDATVSGDITSGKDTTITAGNDALLSGAIEAKGDVTIKAENKIESTGDKISAEGAVDISGTNGVSVDNVIKAGDKVTVESDAGSVTLNGAVESGAEVEVTAKVDADVNAAVKAEGNVAVNAGNDATVSGNVTSGKDAIVTAGNDATVSGDITSGKDTTVTAGNEVAVSGSVDSKGKVTAQGASVTLDGNVNAEQHILLDALMGDLSINKNVQNTAEGIELYAKEGKIDISQNITAGGTGLLRVYADLEGQEQGAAVEAKGKLQSVEGSVDIGATNGNISINEISAKEMAAVGTDKGDVVLGDISAGTVVLFNKDADSSVAADKVIVGKTLVIQSANPEINDVQAAPGAQEINLDITGAGGKVGGRIVIDNREDQVDYKFGNLAVGTAKVYTGGNISVKNLYVNGEETSELVAKESVAIDSLAVANKLLASGYDYTTSVFGKKPEYDGSNAIYFDNGIGSIEPQKNKLDLEKLFFGKEDKQPAIDSTLKDIDNLNIIGGDDSGKGMNLYIDGPHDQTSNGKLLHNVNYYYVHGQRYSGEDLARYLTDYKAGADYRVLCLDPFTMFERYDLYELPGTEIVNGQIASTFTDIVIANKEETKK